MGVAIASSFQSGLGSPPTELLSPLQLKDTMSVSSGLCPALGSRGAVLGYTQCCLAPERRQVREAGITMATQRHLEDGQEEGKGRRKRGRSQGGHPCYDTAPITTSLCGISS